MAFCGESKIRSARLWCDGEKSAAPKVGIKLTSRSNEILPLFHCGRHVSADVPDRAHSSSMYPQYACGRASLECMEKVNALSFYALESPSDYMSARRRSGKKCKEIVCALRRCA